MKAMAKEKTMNMNTAVGLLDIKEDLLDDKASNFGINQSIEYVNAISSNGKFRQAKSTKIKTEVGTYKKLLASAVKKLGCTASELTTWLNKLPNTPEAVKRNALRLITKHELDPFTDEIAINQYEDNQWQVFITIDGWSKIINNHPAFCGISFTESNELISGVPTWMRCAIYRSDRVVPIEVKEYLCEIKTEHSIWKDMPRRMLRYRVIAQCARLAFGVSVPERKKGLKLVNGDGETIKIHNDYKKIVSQTEKLKINLKTRLR
jgi:hypothetical protein